MKKRNQDDFIILKDGGNFIKVPDVAHTRVVKYYSGYFYRDNEYTSPNLNAISCPFVENFKKYDENLF